MIYDESAIGKHPASFGYRLEFFAGSDDFSDFESGSGSFTVGFPEFEITGLRFEGKEQFQLPTGEDLQNEEDFPDLENQINLICSFSGVLDGQTGLATENIKELGVFTGSSLKFDADILNETNLIKKDVVNVGENTESFIFSLTSGDIGGRVEENIFYKIVPFDFLTFSNPSSGVGGIMATGFPDRIVINTDEYIISRENYRDLQITNLNPSAAEIFTGSNIVIADGLINDVSMEFELRTNETVTISGSGSEGLTGSNISVSNDKATIGPNKEFVRFTVKSLLDVNGNRESFLITEIDI